MAGIVCQVVWDLVFFWRDFELGSFESLSEKFNVYTTFFGGKMVFDSKNKESLGKNVTFAKDWGKWCKDPDASQYLVLWMNDIT